MYNRQGTEQTYNRMAIEKEMGNGMREESEKLLEREAMLADSPHSKEVSTQEGKTCIFWKIGRFFARIFKKR
jgi:hypothetical protein